MLATCVKHRDATAGWKCDACDSTLCPACVATQLRGGARFDQCTRCGGFVRQITVPRGEKDPFNTAQLINALRWPFTGPGLLITLACAVVLSLFGLLGAGAIGRAVMVAFLFQIVRHTALGKDDLPGPEDFHGYYDDVVSPSWRLIVALAWIWIPAVAWTHWHQKPSETEMAQQQRAVEQALKPGGQGVVMQGGRVVRGPNGLEVIDRDAPPPAASPEQQEQLREAQLQEAADAAAREAADHAALEARGANSLASHLIPALLVLLGVLIAPMSLLASALKTPLSIAANPIVLVGYAWKLGRDYGLTVLYCCLAVAAAYGLRALEHGALSVIPLHGFVFNFAYILVAEIAFRGIGLLVRARGADLGYGAPEHYLVPVLPDAVPLIVLPAGGDATGVIVFDHAGNPVDDPAAVAERLSRPIEPIELDDYGSEPTVTGSASAPAAAPSYLPTYERELDLSPADTVLPNEDPNDALVRLLAIGDHTSCFSLLETHGAQLRSQAMAAQSWFALGKKAQEASSGKAAAVALKRCIDAAPEGPYAPPAWLLAARVYDQLLGERAASEKLLKELIKRFPDSQEGKFAVRRVTAGPQV